MTQDQIQQLLAAGLTPEQMAAAIAGAGKTKNSSLAALGRAEMPKDRLQSLSHPEGAPLVNGRGQFDGSYSIEITSVAEESTKKGTIMKVMFRIRESSNPLVEVGSIREHPLFQWIDAARSETRGVLQRFYEAQGNHGDFVDDEPWYLEATGESNKCAGLKFRLEVYTEPQRRDVTRLFTHLRYSADTGAPITMRQPVHTPAATAPATTTIPAATIPPSLPGGSAAVSYPQKPDTWPANVPWPFPA